ncbi:DUF1828 domain-containing protein [uncultured Lactobacillus sp.]|uniref:DUF1828 domain-containing protein n=1 Tax=uncultured Lactobacillus sp. TaxID=153152 RepID=UPI002587F37D|nr:DUF1828 domain-containing protein [uncultured Lactobacillus sp.]
MLDAEKLREKHLEWYNQNTSFENLNDNVVAIDVPFLDNFSDEIEMYAVGQKNGLIKLTDDGWTLDNLLSRGVDINKSKKRKSILINQLRGYGISLIADELTTTVDINHFAEAKNRLLQAILFTNDMFMLARNNTGSIFVEDVGEFLTVNNIRATANVAFYGNSGMTFKFEYLIAGIKDIPTRLIKTLSVPNNPVFAKSILTDITEARKIRKNDTTSTDYYVFVNDIDNSQKALKSVKPEITSMFEDNDIKPVLYSKRDSVISELQR